MKIILLYLATENTFNYDLLSVYLLVVLSRKLAVQVRREYLN